METFQLASGGPAGGQTFEKFDKQVLRAVSIYSKAVGSSSISDLRAAPMPDGEGYSTFFIKPEPCRMGKARSVPTIVRPPHNIHNTSNTDSLTSSLGRGIYQPSWWARHYLCPSYNAAVTPTVLAWKTFPLPLLF